MEMTVVKQQVMALLNQVPREPGTSLPGGVTEEELAAFEHATGLILPAELMDWLKMYNGPCVGPGGIYGIAPAREFLTIEMQFKLHPGWKEKGWFPVAGDGVGNEYVLDSSTGKDLHHPIYFLDHEESVDQPAYIVASNLWTFLWFLLQSEMEHDQHKVSCWPFNKEKVLAVDPALAEYEGSIPLPWETL
ncbi:MAG: SMI1/KNR4 family protein [Armatimonadota bacterium]